MAKDVNFTLRLSPELKHDAELAALQMDVTIAQVVRRSLQNLVRDAAAERAVNLQVENIMRQRNMELEAENALSAARGGPVFQPLTLHDAYRSSIRSMLENGMISPERYKQMLRRINAEQEAGGE